MFSSTPASRLRLACLKLEDRSTPAAHLFAVGTDAGGPPQVHVYDAAGGLQHTIPAYASTFHGGVRAATGDVNGDGTDDIVTAAGPGGEPHVKVFDGATGGEIRSFFAYDAGFQGGVTVAVGDVNGDGMADIVTGAGRGGGPHVRVFDGATGALAREFFAFDAQFRGGVNVAAGDVTGDGKADLITAAGPGGGPHVKVFDAATGEAVRSFFAYGTNFAGGVSVAVGDVTGDGRADVVTGAGHGGGPRVKVFDANSMSEVRSFLAYTPEFTGGVNVAAGDFNQDGSADIVTAAGPGGGPHVKVFDGQTQDTTQSFFAFHGAFVAGVTTGNGVFVPPPPAAPAQSNPFPGLYDFLDSISDLAGSIIVPHF